MGDNNYKRINRRRLKSLLNLFQKLPKKNINLGLYCEREGRVDVDEYGNFTPAKDIKLRTVQNQIEKEHTCDTIGCIAGWTVIKFGPPSWIIDQFGDILDEKGARIDIENEARALLFGEGYYAGEVFAPNGSQRSDRAEIIHRLKDVLKNGERSKYLTFVSE